VAYLYRLQPPRPAFAQDMSEREAEVMGRHFAYWQDLMAREVALAYGPVHDPADPWGLGLLDIDEEPAARAVGQDDPAVEAGICTFEVWPIDLARPG
jgi:YCII-related domain